MDTAWKRTLVWSPAAAALFAGVVFAFSPRPVVVDLVEAKKAPMRVTVDEEGETRVHDVFGVSAPVAGMLRRIEVHVGDPVVAGESILARLEPLDPAFLDPRSDAQARAAVQAAESALVLARAGVEEARAELAFAAAEKRRADELRRSGSVSARDADEAERAWRTASASMAAAEASLQVRAHELEQARAQLLAPPAEGRGGEKGNWIVLKAARDGRVLRVVNDSERVVTAGELLLEIGDPSDLEVVVDFLSSDAVQIEPGQRVLLERSGLPEPVEGRVRRVEPFGFTKVSALGIEEQRVNVVIDLTSPRERWERLGHGYQVEARVVLWESDSVLAVPLTSLFRDADRWAVFVDDGGRAQRRFVDVGHRGDVGAEIRSGLGEGDRVVAHPSDRVVDGVRLRGR